MRPIVLALLILFLTSCLGEGTRAVVEQQKILNKFDSITRTLDSLTKNTDHDYPVDVFLDTVLKGNTFIVSFNGPSMKIKFNGETTGGAPVNGDHFYRRAIEIRDHGKTERNCVVFTGSTGVLAVEEDTSDMRHTNYTLFKIVNNKMLFLDLEEDKVVQKESLQLNSCKFLMYVDNRYLLALTYHDTRNDTIPYFDEKGKYMAPMDHDVRYYGFRKTDLKNLTTISFEIDGTGNEYADNKDREAMIQKAVKHGMR
jgi:hypothetical protein